VVFLELKSLMYDMNFVSIVFDKHGMPRKLDKNTCAITTKCSGLSDIEFGLNVHDG
ncbi:type V toxin-antitoxin system endoribonuclease antitoxin GhoS, partial [Escherichia coli]|nr:type V toxin-antitoxin system endoribonuclease antitoxin GhoS [Escherichia coli]